MKKIAVFLYLWLVLLMQVVNAQVISTYAGNGYDGAGNNGNPNYNGDNGPAIQAQISPQYIAADSKGNIYISQGGAYYTVRKIDAKTGIITTVAGNTKMGYTGDGGPATSASLNEPRGIAFDSHDNLFIADYWNNCIRRVDAVSGIITTIAGNGNIINGYRGDGGPAKDALLFEPFAIAFDKADDLYFTDFNNNCIRRIDAGSGIITKVAGSDPPGYAGFSGDGGPAVDARLFAPGSIAINKSGDVIFADFVNNRIRQINSKTGIISTVAGNGEEGFGGDGGPAVNAQIYAPWSLSLDDAGNIYVCDGANNRSSYQVRKIDVSTGIINAFAGNGSPDYSGDGGPPLKAGMAPRGTVFDNDGNMFIGDAGSSRVRKIIVAPLGPPKIDYTGTCTQKATSFKLTAAYVIDSARWSFGDTGNTSIETSPQFSFAAAGKYTVSVTVYSGGKSAAANADINMIDCSTSGAPVTPGGYFELPNTFTPNGDGINDEFKPIYATPPLNYNLLIYDRYGSLLFASKSMTQGWKGNYKEHNCPVGVYYYIATYRYESGTKQTKSGSITLLR
ncbi:gliding motility-associated C-terminal domain-containing protein [Mucilaginibacter sp. dw_454]|uniref:NHL domain-containing protein n=1 Tax=Mucilaginibacter sp. dw_454 TaxID=2720079 RepID=UPI001BD61863|nr:gliding motility-associated C-terminal domain-containing protein [Mucilaginibacter sp. dw_454]